MCFGALLVLCPNHVRPIPRLCGCVYVCVRVRVRATLAARSLCCFGTPAAASEKDYEARMARAAKSNILHSFADGRQLGATGRTPQVTH